MLSIQIEDDSNSVYYCIIIYLFKWDRFAMNIIQLLTLYEGYIWFLDLKTQMLLKVERTVHQIICCQKPWVSICFIAFTTDASIFSSSNQSFMSHVSVPCFRSAQIKQILISFAQRSNNFYIGLADRSTTNLDRLHFTAAIWYLDPRMTRSGEIT